MKFNYGTYSETTGYPVWAAVTITLICCGAPALAETGQKYIVEPGHPSLQVWLLPDRPPSPADNKWTAGRAELGMQLFFDPRLSGTGKVTCFSCHFPERGWGDGLPKSVRFLGEVRKRATTNLINSGYKKILMWDGRRKSLEHQVGGGLKITSSINAGSLVGPDVIMARLREIKGYRDAFEKNYPGEGITVQSVAKAIAAFERTLISNDSPFDRWVKGDASAMTEQQVRGFKLFLGPKVGNCVVCHHPPNFTDDGFHNIGLKSFGDVDHDVGRFKYTPIKLMDGAFLTPTLRDVALTDPYFHDGSAVTLMDVVEHYVKGGEIKTNLSPNMKPANLTQQEKEGLVAFLKALTTKHKPFVYPILPQE